ncbi:hypothetical protein Lpp126_16274, partial [Lacticaseibacillus paracasei subsp. paracasei Lpp126]
MKPIMLPNQSYKALRCFAMDNLDCSLINDYNHIGRRIAAIKQQACSFEYAFWQQSFMGSSLALDENGNRLSAPN